MISQLQPQGMTTARRCCLSLWQTLTVFFVLVSLSVVSLSLTVASDPEQEGKDFLKANKDKEGVITLPSGLQYKVLKKGSGLYHPKVSTPCSCHYSGQLLDGTVFDSSYERGSPTTFAPNQVIKGWTEAMQLMVEGDKWELYIPSDLAYGDHGSPPKIPGKSVLIFQMEIMEILGDDKVLALTCDPLSDDKTGCNEKEQAYVTKISAWDGTKKVQEVQRLQKMQADDTNIKSELKEWMGRRLHILKAYPDVQKGLKASDEEEL